MAKIELLADVSKAKKAIDELDKKLRDLDKDAKKPIRPNVQPPKNGGGKNGGGAGGGAGGGGMGIPIMPGAFVKGTGSFIQQMGGALGLRAAGAVGGGLGAIGNIATGAAMGGAVGALAAAAVQLVSSVGEFKGAIGGMKKGVEAILDPQTEMRGRTAWKDSLMDRARTNGATMAEQFATEEARSNVLGEVSKSLFDKMTQAIQSAFAGDEKTGNALAMFGLHGKDLQGLGTLEQQDLIFKTLSERLAAVDAIEDPAAKSRAEAELFSALKEITGARNMLEARTFIGSYGDYAQQKAMFIQEYQQRNPEGSDERMLEAARLAEFQETLAKIEQNREVDPSLSGYAVEAGYNALSNERVANAELGAVRGNLTREGNDYNRAIQQSSTYQSSLESISRNTARNNQLMERLLNQTQPQPQQQPGDSVATYS